MEGIHLFKNARIQSQTVDHCLEEITVGSFVAVYLEKLRQSACYRISCGSKIGQLGRTIGMALTKANGSYKIPPRSHSPWEDKLPKTCIILCSFP